MKKFIFNMYAVGNNKPVFLNEITIEAPGYRAAWIAAAHQIEAEAIRLDLVKVI